MPAATLIIVVGAWVGIVLLTGLAYRFNRHRSED